MSVSKENTPMKELEEELYIILDDCANKYKEYSHSDGVKAIKALIHNQVLEARIIELDRIDQYKHEYKEYNDNGTSYIEYDQYIEDRIDELSKQKKQNMKPSNDSAPVGV